MSEAVEIVQWKPRRCAAAATFLAEDTQLSNVLAPWFASNPDTGSGGGVHLESIAWNPLQRQPLQCCRRQQQCRGKTTGRFIFPAFWIRSRCDGNAGGNMPGMQAAAVNALDCLFHPQPILLCAIC
jgi:hypothetical protein